MQKLNLKKRFAKTLLAVILPVLLTGTFFVMAGEVRAGTGTVVDGAICSVDSDCKSNYCLEENGKKVCTMAFEVSLQTPFAEPPNKWDPSVPCTVTEDADVYKTKDDYLWVCRMESKEWIQIVRGEDGGVILENYAKLLYKWLAGFIGIVAVLILIVGGIQISTAGANQEGLQSGKDRIIAALVGLTLLFLSSLILYTINPTFFV
ncbi:MAG: pilin [Patescibacteria group bacterium]